MPGGQWFQIVARREHMMWWEVERSLEMWTSAASTAVRPVRDKSGGLTQGPKVGALEWEPGVGLDDQGHEDSRITEVFKLEYEKEWGKIERKIQSGLRLSGTDNDVAPDTLAGRSERLRRGQKWRTTDIGKAVCLDVKVWSLQESW